MSIAKNKKRRNSKNDDNIMPSNMSVNISNDSDASARLRRFSREKRHSIVGVIGKRDPLINVNLLAKLSLQKNVHDKDFEN